MEKDQNQTIVLTTSDSDIKIAANAVISGQLVAFPTETVYGLGGDAFNNIALAKIFEAKKRPHFDPLIIHIAEIGNIEKIAELTALKPNLRKKFDELISLMPGPLTLILPKKPNVPDLATSALPTVAIRYPSHPVAQKLIRLSTGAIAAPSANPFGYLSPTTADHVKAQLENKVDFIIDGGRTNIGLESTVLDISSSPPTILRLGGTPKEDIEAIIGQVQLKNSIINERSPMAPGQLSSHYAPHTPLILCNHEEMMNLAYEKGKSYLFFSKESLNLWKERQNINETDYRIQVLSEKGDMIEAAANFFEILHKLDKLSVSAIYAEKVPDKGLGKAINDRLFRASRH